VTALLPAAGFLEQARLSPSHNPISAGARRLG